MKVAITVWQQRVSPVFDVSANLLMLSLHDGKIADEQAIPLPTSGPAAKLAFIAALQPDVLICGAMSAQIQHVAETHPWQLYAFMKGSVRRVMRALIAGGVLADDFSLPGCTARNRCCTGNKWAQCVAQEPHEKRFGRPLCQSEKNEN
ncbi:NifB/NifX family molybdenum-iron cluster-binding protein [Reinekea marinisedimentorum]|uniref:Putative Fe-Mo cluster-binding NifX family protein n=1 Tax=Reinekea marinisedimentorum TaxID=230495 RepID=A0A4V2UJJ4_9GAMM|nr:hypothetical protein [Reinekea marinisedimentorum]TCS40368.1 putative Fe-Mo cluster-binding NifX family protein [Reinekea marinisedimentorum]